MALIDCPGVRRAPRVGRLFVALFLAAWLGRDTLVHAGVVLSLPTNVPATAGTTSSFFDVFMEVTGTANVSSFQFSLDLPSTSGVTFTAADTTSPGYLFPGSSGIGWTLANNSLTITAGDLDLSPPAT